ncbi:MAG TPA: tRNA lysidine(34) synthetase TilS [Steroidobacteraceae bacterium]|nr:tRNA lysidine(34) synthetase TilS [Steroidobacteraceae bacterium]
MTYDAQQDRVIGAVERSLTRLIPGWPEARLCVALSGGVDSVTLLAACVDIRSRRGRPALRAAHVHHGLQPEADAWQAHCEALCGDRRIPLEVVRVAIDLRPGASPEAAARDARYRALQGLLAPGEFLLTAHHLDDQLETVLLQLCRGAGVAGLSAMPPVAALGRAWCLRPMLGLTRRDIEDHARRAGLAWVEDPMNAATRFDRSLLRHEVTPVLRARWPAIARSVAQSAGHLAESRELLDEIAAGDAVSLVDDGRVDIARLLALSRPRQANFLRWWLRQRGLGIPSRARLAAILNQVLPARADARPLVRWSGGEVRRYRGRLYAMRPLDRVSEGSWAMAPGQVLDIAGVGRVTLAAATGRGVSRQRCPGPFELRLRRGGERLRPAGHAITKTVKRLLQEAGTEPWLRERMPLLYARDRLLMVGDRWVAAETAAGPGEPGLVLAWTGADTAD